MLGLQEKIIFRQDGVGYMYDWMRQRDHKTVHIHNRSVSVTSMFRLFLYKLQDIL
jgi:hypothetical protein